jgi:hypothetical protein
MDEKEDPESIADVGGGATTESDPEPIEPPPPPKGGWTVPISPPDESGDEGGRQP